MRTLAVDYGDVRTGIAVSDLTGTLAGEAKTVKETNPEKMAIVVADEAAKCSAGLIIIGRPLNMDGSAGPRAEKCDNFATLVAQHTQIPIKMWDERLTTVDALRILSDSGKKGKKQRSKVDAVAASIILQSWLDGPGKSYHD